jgi:tartrate-resistant acid phosphatase type 5
MKQKHISALKLASLASLIALNGCVVVDWVDSTLFYSKVIDPQPIPKFEIPAKEPGVRYLQFEAVGDFGTGAGGQRDVAVSMASKASKDSISFVLVLGDNSYESGVESITDDQWKTKFVDMYDQPSLNVPFYAVLGNHDVRSNPQAQVKYTKVSKRWKMPERYYSLVEPIDDSTSVEIFCLDTSPLAYLGLSEAKALSDKGVAMRQIHWLSHRLQQSTARWKIVTGHHTIYSGGEHGDNGTLQYLLEPLFIKYHVDFYVCGHDHDLELLKPIHGVTYIVSGAGGKHRDVRWRANTEYAATNLGFTFFRLSRNDALVEFLNRSGHIDFAYSFHKSDQ